MTNKEIVKKILDEYNLKHKMEISKIDISQKLLVVMKNHIGKANAVSRNDLFKKLYNVEEDTNNLEHWFIWNQTKKAMHNIRKTTKCFISMRRTSGANFEFFVVEDRNDAKEYVDVINKNIHQMKSMIGRAIKAADENWSEQNWELTKSNLKKLNYHKKVNEIKTDKLLTEPEEKVEFKNENVAIEKPKFRFWK